MSMITPPPAAIAAELAVRNAIVDPVLAKRGLRQTRNSAEYPRGRTERLVIKGQTYVVRVIKI